MGRIQWCRSLLSIGGVNLHFYPNFALFSTFGGINLDQDLVKTKKKMQAKHFFSPILGEDQKKKVFSKNRTLFSPILGEDQKRKKVFSKNRTLFFPDFRWRPKKKRSSASIKRFFPQIYAQLYTHSN